MTTNERIAKKMGWNYFSTGGFPLSEIGNNWESVKAMQARMIKDGIQFVFAQDDEHQTSATAFILNSNREWDEFVVQLETHDLKDEMFAIVELFKKVYSINGDSI
jgi:hypothetical protein